MLHPNSKPYSPCPSHPPDSTKHNKGDTAYAQRHRVLRMIGQWSESFLSNATTPNDGHRPKKTLDTKKRSNVLNLSALSSTLVNFIPSKGKSVRASNKIIKICHTFAIYLSIESLLRTCNFIKITENTPSHINRGHNY